MQMVLLQGRHESRTSRRYDDVMSRESLRTDMRPESVDCKSPDTLRPHLLELGIPIVRGPCLSPPTKRETFSMSRARTMG